MPAINFPPTPTPNVTTHTEAGLTWIYRGSDIWEAVPPATQFNFVQIQDENDVLIDQRPVLKVIAHDVVEDIPNDRVILNRQQESAYRFEVITTMDQDLWLENETIYQITKSVGVDTLEYRINAGSWVPVTFTGDTWTGTLNITAGQVLSWRITYNGGYTSASFNVFHKRTL
jgi:hypothetical protein